MVEHMDSCCVEGDMPAIVAELAHGKQRLGAEGGYDVDVSFCQGQTWQIELRIVCFLITMPFGLVMPIGRRVGRLLTT
jgi:hypothetical protein